MKKTVGLLFLVLLTAGMTCADLLDGMGSIVTWTDYETQSGDMPGYIWGNSDAQRADKIGLRVDFAGGLSGTVVYSGVSALWNTSNFTGLNYDSATGFFTTASGLHFLYNVAKGGTLPMAWSGFSMPFSGNFDLDYSEAYGSNFRASTSGWTSATFTTYSSTAAIPEPATALILGLGGALIALYRRFFGRV